MEKILKAGVIGCGAISKNHLKALAVLENAECAAVCDTVEEKRNAARDTYGIKKTYADYREMLKDPEIDVIHICTPHYLHAEMAVESLRAGKHVLCEKPEAVTLTDAEKMIRTAEETGKTLGICFQNRYNEASVEMKRIMDQKELGKFLGAKGQVTWNREAPYYENSPWRGRWKTEGGSALINQSIHTLDLMLWLSVRAEKVSAGIATRKLKGIIETEDTADLMLTGPDGEHMLFYASNCYVKNAPVEVEIICEEGSMKLTGTVLSVTKNGKTETKDYSSGNVYGKDYWGSGHGFLISDFYDCVRTGRKFPIGGTEASHAVSVLEAAYRSAKAGTEEKIVYADET